MFLLVHDRSLQRDTFLFANWRRVVDWGDVHRFRNEGLNDLGLGQGRWEQRECLGLLSRRPTFVDMIAEPVTIEYSPQDSHIVNADLMSSPPSIKSRHPGKPLI